MKGLAVSFKTLTRLIPDVAAKSVGVGAPIRLFMPVEVPIASRLVSKPRRERATVDSGALESQGTNEIQVCILLGQVMVLCLHCPSNGNHSSLYERVNGSKSMFFPEYFC